MQQDKTLDIHSLQVYVLIGLPRHLSEDKCETNIYIYIDKKENMQKTEKKKMVWFINS